MEEDKMYWASEINELKGIIKLVSETLDLMDKDDEKQMATKYLEGLKVRLKEAEEEYGK